MQKYSVRYSTKKILSSDETVISDSWTIAEAEDFADAVKQIVEKFGKVYKLTIINVTDEGV
jgi:hypothetical protein